MEDSGRFSSSYCVRCKGLLSEPELKAGFSTCDRCQVRIQSERSPDRKCLVDGSDLRQRIVYGVVIDQCPECGGVWLDGAELGLIESQIRQEQLQGGNFASGLCLGLVT